ncbi:MAG: phenylalanine--tRNA ligase subunit alpha, partial [Promethearchaeota archaeon]
IYIYNKEGPKSELELLIDSIKDKDIIIMEDIPKEHRDEIKTLLKRKLVTKRKYIQRIVSLTELGKKVNLSQIKIKSEEIAKLKPQDLVDGSWKEILPKLKKFEVENPGPKIFAGKLHPLTILINKIRNIFLSMGFIEIKGPIVESAFYNFDALYQPQDHPAREMHDTFYLRNPSRTRLPPKKYVKAIKDTHEHGGNSKSTGWGYKWDEEIAKKALLRTHTTATTIRRLSKIIRDKEKLPLKVFSIDKVFRNENVDKSHLAEFIQIEGIVIGENVNLSHLKGILSEFYAKMGFPKIITRPGFFPYTEPSMEIAVYSDILGKWLEMGGSGIFRPEVTYPWGVKEPIRVLAWGMGFERLAMLYLKREDIRDLYRSPLSWLRDQPYL